MERKSVKVDVKSWGLLRDLAKTRGSTTMYVFRKAIILYAKQYLSTEGGISDARRKTLETGIAEAEQVDS